MNRISPTRKVPNHKLHSLMLNQGLGPNQLADKVKVSGPTIRLALGGHVPEPPVQFAIASYFGVEVTELFPLERQRQYV